MHTEHKSEVEELYSKNQTSLKPWRTHTNNLHHFKSKLVNHLRVFKKYVLIVCWHRVTRRYKAL